MYFTSKEIHVQEDGTIVKKTIGICLAKSLQVPDKARRVVNVIEPQSKTAPLVFECLIGGKCTQCFDFSKK